MRTVLPLLLLPLGLLACDGGDADGTDTDSDDASADEAVVYSMALATFGFAREADKISAGFDLDGKDGGCEIDDFTSPDGVSGIDNSFGPLLPVIEAAGGQALEELIQREVIEGGFQMVLSWALRDGACESFAITRTWGSPMTSVGGELIPGQTLDPHPAPELAPITLDCTLLEDGTVRAEGFTLPVKLQVFSTEIDLPLEGGVAEIRPTDDPTRWEGVIAGAIPMTVLKDFVDNLSGIGPTLPGILDSVLQTRADVDGEDGPCTKMSAVTQFSTLPAFVFDEPPVIDSDTDFAP